MGSIIRLVSVGYAVRLMPSKISPYWGLENWIFQELTGKRFLIVGH